VSVDRVTRDELVKAIVSVVAAYLTAKATVRVMREAQLVPSEARFWHRVMLVSQATAEAAGRVAMRAEARYWRAVDGGV
jgi:hypothetical protein